MLASFAFIFIFGLEFAQIASKLKLPRIVGMIAAGILIGPFALDLIDGSVLGISADLRKIALVVILLRAGLSLDPADLKKVGRPALLMSFVPASFEILGYCLVAPRVFGISLIDAAVMGAVLSAVSPAVVVPRMISLTERGLGTEKGIPQLIMAGASCDDVFVIVLFTSFTDIARIGRTRITDLCGIPVSIVLGMVIGAVVGLAAAYGFEWLHSRQKTVRNSLKVIILLALALLLASVEKVMVLPVSGLLAVICMACALNKKAPECVTKRLSEKFGKIWLAAEVLLFVLLGASVDVSYTLKAGLGAVGVIFAALIFRAVGVLVCLIGTELNFKERLFCVISYIPKATVQAAIGSIPLAMGLDCGEVVLSVAVVGILLTAPLGAAGIDLLSEKLLGGKQKL